jgi:hypothetical protein
MRRRKWCHVCGLELNPLVPPPARPDFWMRLAGEEWLPTLAAPHPGEVAASLGYTCAPCAKSFRLVMAADRERFDPRASGT